MKRLLRAVGIVLILGAAGLYIISAKAQNEAQPSKMTTGIMVNGEYKAIDSGYIGGNSKLEKEMEDQKKTSVIIGVVGIGMTVASYVIKEEKETHY